MKTNSWLICPKPNLQARLRLFCFPYAGGGASIFSTWSNDLPPEVEICSIQLPNRENRLQEAPFTCFASLVQMLAQVLYSHLDMPFAFFGHSMGALISFELARQLVKTHNLCPVYLFVSGCRAPQVPNLEPPIHHLPDVEFIEEIRRLNGTPELALQDTALMQLIMPTLRADFALAETYVYSTDVPLECPISVFGGLEDAKISYDNLAAWQDHTSSSFRLRIFPGDHFFLKISRSLLLTAITQEITPYLNEYL